MKRLVLKISGLPRSISYTVHSR